MCLLKDFSMYVFLLHHPPRGDYGQYADTDNLVNVKNIITCNISPVGLLLRQNVWGNLVLKRLGAVTWFGAEKFTVKNFG